MPTFDPKDWIDILAYLIAAAVILVPILKTLRSSREIRDEVKNSHDSNLRDDVDLIIKALVQQGKKLDRVGKDVRQLRGGHRRNRRQLRRLRKFAARNHPDQPAP